jgi:membrane protein implicated in regulation of membrane protease activity
MNMQRKENGMTQTTMYIIWAIAIVAFGVLEGITAQLVSIWFVIGSVASLISALLGASFPVQIIVFIAVSALALIATRPIVKKKLNTKVQPTNADRCIGQDGVVIEEINNLVPSGQVKVDGKVWTARSSNKEIIPKGDVVTVEKIDGVKLVVSNKITINK